LSRRPTPTHSSIGSESFLKSAELTDGSSSSEVGQLETAAPGKIIFLNGASSSGKSTLARGMQAKLRIPFWHISIDHLRAAHVLPDSRIESGEFLWRQMRPSFFDGFHRCLPALCEAGNNLIVEHIVETSDWMNRLLRLLGHLDVFFVGLHCSLSELEQREIERGDRRIGQAKLDYETVHTFGTYDLEVTSTESPAQNVEKIICAWKVRQRPSAFDTMARHLAEP
jgi:chloramphenicol 3-O phosphotransferase